jgi:hypothetical protein
MSAFTHVGRHVRIRPSSTLLSTLLASLALAVLSGGFVSTRDFRPTVYFMPGDLGRQVGSSVDPKFSGPEIRSLRISARPFDCSTGFLTRAIGLRPGEENTWGRHNGITESLSFIHNLSNVFPTELAKTHPEYFPFVEGKRLAPPKGSGFWNPDLGRADVAKYAANQAISYFKTHPDAETFSLGVNDALVFGDSPETKAFVAPLHYFRGRPDFSPLVFTFMNRAAAELAKTYPDKYLGCLAYYWCENTPPFPVDPHVIPFLTADRSQSYDPAFRHEEMELQEKWASALRAPVDLSISRSEGQKDGTAEAPRDGMSEVPKNRSELPFDRSSDRPRKAQVPAIRPRLGLYDYLDGHGFLVPRVPIHAFAEHIQHAYRVGFTDYVGESSRNWGLDGPMPWVIAQLLRNPEQNVDALLAIYYENYFQSAAKPMRRFFERCEEQWMRQTGPSYWLKYYRNQSQTALFPPAVCAELRTLLNDAAKQADSDVVRQRVAFVSDSFRVTEHFVAFQAARDALSRAVLLKRTVPRSDVESASPRASRSPRFNSEQSPSSPSPPSRDEDSASSPLPLLPSVQTEQLFRLLSDYSARRSEFIRYTHQTTDRWPLAFSPINYDDFLRDDPGFAAALALATVNRGLELRSSGDQRVGSDPPINRYSELPAAAAASALAEREHRVRDLPINGKFDGPVKPGRRIAGLQYGVDLPAPWSSQVEPTQRGEAELQSNRSTEGQKDLSDLPIDGASELRNPKRWRALRISGAETTTVYQWQPAQPGKLYLASVLTRGLVSNSDMVTLTLGWLDAKMKHIGTVVVMRLPDGRWPEWVELQQGARAPANAAHVGIGIRVMHQVPGDSIDFADFHLREAE